MKKGLMNILVVSEDNTEDDKLAVRCISIADIYIYIYITLIVWQIYTVLAFLVFLSQHISHQSIVQTHNRVISRLLMQEQLEHVDT